MKNWIQYCKWAEENSRCACRYQVSAGIVRTSSYGYASRSRQNKIWATHWTNWLGPWWVCRCCSNITIFWLLARFFFSLERQPPPLPPFCSTLPFELLNFSMLTNQCKFRAAPTLRAGRAFGWANYSHYCPYTLFLISHKQATRNNVTLQAI